jgi:hypothetical protein
MPCIYSEQNIERQDSPTTLMALQVWFMGTGTMPPTQHFGIHGLHCHHLTHHHTWISPLFPLSPFFVLSPSFSPGCQALDLPGLCFFHSIPPKHFRAFPLCILLPTCLVSLCPLREASPSTGRPTTVK